MAFEKKPYAHLYPILSDYEDDTDIQLEQVKQLSLQTAAEDDERRRSKLAREVHNSVVSSVSQGIHASNSLPELLRDSEKKAFSNTFDRLVPDLGDRTVSMPISRPRPQAGNPTSQRFVPVQPVTTPSAKVTTVPPPLPVVGPNASLNRSANCTIGSSLQQSKPEIPPRPIQYNVPYSSSQSVSPPFGKSALEMGSQISTPNRITAKDNDAPLINLSPPCLVSALGDFDLNDLDPFWRPTARIPTNPSVSNVLANQANTKINTTSLSSVLPQQLPNAAYAKSNVPSSVSVSVQVKPSITYNMSNPLPSASVQLQQTTSNRSIPAVSRASPHVGLTESQMYGLMWPVAPTYGWNWSNGMPVCAAPKTEMPQFQSGFKTRVGDMPTGSLARSPILGQDDRNSIQAGKGIQDAVETWTNSSSLPSNIDANRSPSSAGFGDVNSPSADNSSRGMLVADSGGSSDLMYFTSDSELEPQFISLQDFDPLYSPECEVCAHCQCFETETDELFSSASKPSPYHPYEVRKASNSFQPALSNTANSKVIATPLPMHQSIDELQDPFSIHDLTVSLEKKRQRHAMEQEARAKQQEPSSVPKPALSRLVSHKTKPKESAYEMLEDFNETADGEIRAFLDMVKRIKSQYSDGNSNTNPGFVVSPRTSRKCDPKMSVKIIVSGRFITEPVIFTCDVNTIVAHVISHVLLSLTDDLGSASVDNFLLKVYGLSEYLTNDSVLNQYEYVQQCLKLDRDISFIIVESDSVSRSFKRTAEDMQCPPFVRKMRPAEDPKYHITKDKLNLLMETFYKEVEKLRDAAIQGSADSASPCGGVVQAVKAICMVLNQIETLDISRAVKRLVDLVKGGGQQSDSYVHVSEDSEGIHRVRVYYPSRSRSESSLSIDDLHIALEDVTKYVKTLIDMYCRTFHTEFRFLTFSSSPQVETTDITKLRESLLIYIASAHQLPLEWKNIYTEYFIVCSVFHGGQRLSVDISSDPKQMSTDGFPGTIVWDNWLTFESIPMSSLPRESRLCLTLIGVRVVPATTNESSHRVNVPLGWVVMQIYNQQFELVQGSQLLCLWPNNIANPLGTNSSNTDSSKAVLIQVNLPDFDNTYIFPSIPEPLPSLKQDFRSLHPDDQEYLQAIIEKDALTRLTEEEGDYLWEKRYYLLDLPAALPRIIQTVNSWSWFALRETYTMIREWASMPPLESLQLLLPTYPDTYVRNKAVDQLKELSPDDLYDLLPQLVQALKFECYHTSALARMLLEKATTNVRFAHFLYWLLKEAADDDHYRKRFHLMFGGLLSIVGEKMRSELSKQEDFVRVLSSIADKVKAGRDKEAVLQRELGNMWEFYNQSNVRIPLNPSLEVTGLDVKSCSYFTSFTCPLKLALKNVDSSAGNSYIMFKAGDDLRQDMLTMQLIRIMDKLWLNEGLDLKMVTFNCQPTGLKRGIVELVMESDTLRKIQVKHGHGLAGSFKDRTIADWLQVHNPTELDYQKAVDNFTASCAGYCVATYVLGICDRHNDNIMIKHSGHIFHIDFAKFLGDAQTFGNFKRDRTPFVLTSDMAYVINGGDKPSERFQYFVDLCCQAFNIIRRNGNLFMNLFSLMIRSGIPGVNANAPKHIQRVLLPDRTDVEAVAEFTRMINKCLQSIFTQVNFFIHNLAQVKFSGHDDGTLLSFVPKTYTINTDGRIRSLEMYGIQKRYSPEKHYVYIVRVERENQRVFSFVMRRYSEFQELHRKLVMTFPLVHLPSLSGRVILGRAHVRAVAEARKEELQAFLRHLLTFSQEVAQHDLIYTFFHPMLKDEQDFDKTDVLKLRDNPDQQSRLNLRRVDGSVKVNLFYKSGEMTVMIMHVKDLSQTSSGEAPNPYVKLYLLPDPTKLTKKKTKITKNSYNPTYNEMFMYRLPLENLKSRTLQILVCSYDTLKENEFLGAIHLPLSEIDWTRADCTAWYRLQTLHVM